MLVVVVRRRRMVVLVRDARRDGRRALDRRARARRARACGPPVVVMVARRKVVGVLEGGLVLD